LLWILVIVYYFRLKSLIFLNINKFLIAVLIFFFINLNIAYSQELTNTSTGTFYIIKQDEISPFNGVIFDPTATAIILTDKEQSNKFFQLKLDYELNKQKADDNLKLSNCKLSLDIETETSSKTLDLKNKQIKELLNSSNNPILYGVGGIIAGIILTLSILFVSKKAGN